MKIKQLLKGLTVFEWVLWVVSVVTVALSFVFSPQKDWWSFVASVIGVTAILFCAKGHVLGQALVVVFAVLYGVISYFQKYYGEMITYLAMSAPIAMVSVITWLKNPYGDTAEVKVSRMHKKQTLIMVALAVVVTVAFYFILRALGNARLITSTLSVTTSFVAAYMAMLRSPYYAVGYAVNDIVLITLWVLAATQDVSALPMVFCFVMFLFNDLYGFINWQRMKKRQEKTGQNP